MFLYLCSKKSWQWTLANACVSSLISPYLCVLISKITRYLINACVHIDMSSLISPYLCVWVSKMIFDCINAKVLTHVISLINFIYSYMYDLFTQRFMFFISVRFLIHIIGFIHFIGPNVCVLWFSSASSMLEFTYAYSVSSVSQVQTRVSGFLNIQVTHYAQVHETSIHMFNHKLLCIHAWLWKFCWVSNTNVASLQLFGYAL